MQDLFGNEIVDRSLPKPSQAKPRRKATPNGYAARPGTGPAGETCGSCRFSARVHGGRKYYWKCLKIEKNWTNSYGTDIRKNSPACRFWQAEENPTGALDADAGVQGEPAQAEETDLEKESEAAEGGEDLQ